MTIRIPLELYSLFFPDQVEIVQGLSVASGFPYPSPSANSCLSIQFITKKFLSYIKTQEKSVLLRIYVREKFHDFMQREKQPTESQLWNGKVKRIEWITNMNIVSVGMYSHIEC